MGFCAFGENSGNESPRRWAETCGYSATPAIRLQSVQVKCSPARCRDGSTPSGRPVPVQSHNLPEHTQLQVIG
jgi:hypothetical protein